MSERCPTCDRTSDALQTLVEAVEKTMLSTIDPDLRAALDVAQDLLAGEGAWVCGDCACQCSAHEWCCWRCGAGRPEYA